MASRRGNNRTDSQPPSPGASDSDEDNNRSPVSGDEEADNKKSPTFGSGASERGRKVGRRGLTVLNDELKRDPLDIVH
jgi:hypothetical protein